MSGTGGLHKETIRRWKTVSSKVKWKPREQRHLEREAQNVGVCNSTNVLDRWSHLREEKHQLDLENGWLS